MNDFISNKEEHITLPVGAYLLSWQIRLLVPNLPSVKHILQACREGFPSVLSQDCYFLFSSLLC